MSNVATASAPAAEGAIGLPKEFASFAGRIMDVDSHEMLPAQTWVEQIGAEVGPIAEHFSKHGEPETIDVNTVNIPDYAGDVLPIDAGIAQFKGARAPGAVNVRRRVDVMKALGIRRQMMFPSNPAIYTMFLWKDASDPNFMKFVKGDRVAQAKRWIDLHNEHLVAAGKISDMLRPVPLLYGDTPEELLKRAEHFIKNGIRCMWLVPAGELPGGRSPAHTDLDPLWSLLSKSNCAVVVHTAGDGNFLKTYAWQDAPAFQGYTRHVEIVRSPWSLAGIHLAFENFLTVLVMGGVFDRHPMLRFGCIECASYWIGPLMRRLDLWHANKGVTTIKDPNQPQQYRLPEKPSFYIKRNVRVTPFFFEDFATDIQNYDVGDVLCYSTDYPHIEGGRGSFKIHYDKIAKLGKEATEKYFVTNGKWLLPD
jgi:predicted TIM-barrel fold metal-dependent hydrolase